MSLNLLNIKQYPAPAKEYHKEVYPKKQIVIHHTSAIYKITNPNGNIYIGQTTKLVKRLATYMRGDCHKQKLLYNSIKKYGWDAHIFEVIEMLPSDLKILNEREVYWIEELRCNRCRYPVEHNLNLTDGGQGSTGNKRTDEQLKNQHKFPKGNTPWNKGIKLPYVDKLIEANTTRKHVFSYDLDGNFIKEYTSIKTASKELGVARCAISNVARGTGGQKRAKEYQFRFFKTDKIEQYNGKFTRQIQVA